MIQTRPCVLYTVLIVSFLFSPISAAGAARIEVDSANFDMGMIHEGTMPSAKHEFKVKNAGTDTLRIERVKPGWGCTVVGFDSIIPPGRVGKVTEEISLKNMHAGVVNKSVSVTSNAENSPSLSLSVRLNFVPAVFASTNYINLVSAKGDSGRENVIITTDKADLQIKKVLFKANDEGQKPMWQVGMSFDIPYAFKRATAVKPDGMWDDTLKLVFFSNDTNGVRGEFIMTTNHPKKSDVTVQGFIRNAPNGQ